MLFGEDDRLHAGDLKPLAAAHILAAHQVVFAEHVGAGFAEAGAVALVSAPGKLALLGAYDPRDLVLSGLMAMGAVQGCHLLLGALAEKIAFFHEIRLLHVRCGTSYGNMKDGVGANGSQEEGKTIPRGAGSEGVGARAHGRAPCREGGSAQEQEAGKAQTDARQATGRTGMTGIGTLRHHSRCLS